MFQPVTHARPIEALPPPYLLFLGDVAEPAYAKTAFGLRDWGASAVSVNSPAEKQR